MIRGNRVAIERLELRALKKRRFWRDIAEVAVQEAPLEEVFKKYIAGGIGIAAIFYISLAGAADHFVDPIAPMKQDGFCGRDESAAVA